MKELVVISGKGGTGKTSVLASFAALARNAVLADCDVDAADLHLVLAPEVRRREEFRSGREAVIRQADCIRCGACLEHCRFEAVKTDGRAAGEATFTIDPFACEGCGVCVRFCPAKAIDFPERLCGEWYVSETRFGPMVHARLGIAAENSGKLVSTVRREARRIAEERRLDWILVDGPPGIGCPVIASIAGASLVLAVTEPTLSGEHDLERVLGLARHFGIPAAVCVNKWDINPALAKRIEESACARGAALAGRISYDRAVTAAQLAGKSAVEYGGQAGREIRSLWRSIEAMQVSTKEGT
jgi:MinD superfamily P-loop ATPase